MAPRTRAAWLILVLACALTAPQAAVAEFDPDFDYDSVAPSEEELNEEAVENLLEDLDELDRAGEQELYCSQPSEEPQSRSKQRKRGSTSKRSYPGKSFSGTASYYDPHDPNDPTGGKGTMANGKPWKNDCSICAVQTKYYLSLRSHRLKVCTKDKSPKCITCTVTDNGPGVRGVDLAPKCHQKLMTPATLAQSRKVGRIGVTIQDLGKGKSSK